MTEERRADPTIERAVRLFEDLRQYETDGPMLAPASDRVLARLIDFVIAFVVLIVATFVAGATAFAIDGPPEDPLNPEPTGTTTLMGWAAIAVVTALLAVNDVLLVSRTGSTAGKLRFKMRVVDVQTGSAPAISRAALRFVVWFLPLAFALTWWVALWGTWTGLLGVLLAAAALCIPGSLLRNEDQRGLHDRVAGTQVIQPRDG